MSPSTAIGISSSASGSRAIGIQYNTDGNVFCGLKLTSAHRRRDAVGDGLRSLAGSIHVRGSRLHSRRATTLVNHLPCVLGCGLPRGRPPRARAGRHPFRAAGRRLVHQTKHDRCWYRRPLGKRRTTICASGNERSSSAWRVSIGSPASRFVAVMAPCAYPGLPSTSMTWL